MKRILPLVVCISLSAAAHAYAGPLQPQAWEVGAEVSQITYKEPGIMKDEGNMYGLLLNYTRISNVVWKADGKFSAGSVDYTGAVCNLETGECTPASTNNITDYMFETRGMIGSANFITLSSYKVPYIGIGYRYLYDGANKGIGGYRRESNYLYIPLGFEGFFSSASEWVIGFTVEYDFFLMGKQVSYLSDADPGYNDIENNQKHGYGYRGSVKFYKIGHPDFIIEPFIRYWNIKQSDTKLLTYYGIPFKYMVEPDNNSTEIGVKFIVRF